METGDDVNHSGGFHSSGSVSVPLYESRHSWCSDENGDAAGVLRALFVDGPAVGSGDSQAEAADFDGTDDAG